MILGTIKNYAIVVGAALLAALLFTVKILAGQNTKLRVENKIAKAKEKHVKKVMEKDREIDEQADVHLAEVAKEVEEGKHPSELTNPGEHWTDVVRDDKDSE